MIAFLRALLRSLAVIAWVLLLMFPVALTQMLGMHRIQQKLLLLFYRGIGYITGLRLQVEGEISPLRPLLVVANHTSYFDVVVLGGLTALRFTPKSDVKRWPLLGWVCSLGHVLYIDRRPSQTKENQRALQAALKAGARICLFPEGTTNGGEAVLPFRSALMSLAEQAFAGSKLPVQPVTLAYTHIGTAEIQHTERDRISWIGESTFLPHLWRLLSLPGITARLRADPVITIDAFADRKELTIHVQELIDSQLKDMLAQKKSP